MASESKTILNISSRRYLLIAGVMIALIPVFVFAGMAHAQPISGNDLWGNGTVRSNVETGLGLGNRDPREIISTVVRVALGFLGILMLGIIIFGVVSAASAGSEGASETARNFITAGVVGLIVILAAWGLSSFIIDAVVTATS